jgi:DNA-binding CsgD family transcriptional regulator
MLLERDAALAALAEYAEQALGGEGRVVLVSGEAGGGKSALVEELETRLPDASWLWGSCDGLFTPQPLGPLYDLAQQLDGEVAQLCRANAPREQLFGALLRQLNAPDRLTVAVIEDMHWADEATVDLLRFVGRRLRGGRVLVLATYRDDSLTARDPWRRAVGELSSHRSTRRISLAPLSLTAVATLAAGSGLDPAELHRLTGGNPFFVTEVLRSGVTEVPESARDAVLARAARLSDPAREVLDVAAVIGARVAPKLLEAVNQEVAPALDEILACGLLGDGGPDPTGPRTGDVRFRHEIARLAIEQAIPAHRRRLLHGRVLSALRELRPDDDARLAFHAEGAGDAAAVIRYATRAGEHAAALSSHREAVCQYERAIGQLTGSGDAAAAALHDALAVELSYLDRYEDSAATGEHALRLWRRTGDKLREGDTLRRLARTYWRLCRVADTAAAARAAVEVLEPLGETAELAWAYAGQANQAMEQRDNATAIAVGTRALELAEALDLPAVRSDALNSVACAYANSGGEWLRLQQQALDVGLAHRLASQTGRSYANMYAYLCGRRDFAAALPYYADGVVYCEDHDLSAYVNCLQGELASTLEKTGRWAEAASLAAGLLARVVSPVNRLNPSISLGTVRARRGEPGVWECLDEAVHAAEGTGEPEWVVAARVARAEAYWLAGDPAAGAAEAERAYEVAARCEPWERGAIAVWLGRTGSRLSLTDGLAEPYRASVAGDWAEAARLWSALGCPYEAALALADADDEASLREALHRLEDLGAAPAVAATRQRMRSLGLRSVRGGARADTRADPAGLTRREREVLDLIRAGMTNAQIGTALFISPKTVDHHVSAVLAKLGAPNRAAAAQRAPA